MKRKNRKYVKLGQAGARKRWSSRWDLLVELTKKYGKERQTEFLKWPTEHLKTLVQLLKK